MPPWKKFVTVSLASFIPFLRRYHFFRFRADGFKGSFDYFSKVGKLHDRE